MTYYAVKMPGLYPGANMVWAFIIGFFLWLPPVLVILFMQRLFVKGLTETEK